MILSDDERQFIKDNIPDAEALMSSNNVDALLDVIDAVVTAKGFDENWNLNDFGRNGQRIYDNIYANN